MGRDVLNRHVVSKASAISMVLVLVLSLLVVVSTSKESVEDPAPEDEMVNDILGAAYAQGRGYNGSGQIISEIGTGICTGDLSTMHLDIRNNVIIGIDYTETDTSDGIAEDEMGLSTLFVGLMVGDGTIGTTVDGYIAGLGIAPGAKAYELRVFNDLGGFAGPPWSTIMLDGSLAGSTVAGAPIGTASGSYSTWAGEIDNSTYSEYVWDFNVSSYVIPPGDSIYAEVWMNVTSATPSDISRTNASQDLPVSGTVTNNYTFTHASDDSYESIVEVATAGAPSSRYSYLEHKWTFDLPASSTHTLYLEAYQSPLVDGDNFVFAYSTNDVTYFNLITVTKEVDDDTYQTASLPGGLSGTIYLRVVDTDQTPGNSDLSTIYIDSMYILSGNPSCEFVLGYDNTDAPSLLISPEVEASVGTPPVADAGPDQFGWLDFLCTFDGSNTTEADGDSVNYTWNFTYNSAPVTLYGVAPSFLFEIEGTYVVTLTTTDKDGSTTDTMIVDAYPISCFIPFTPGWNLVSYWVDTGDIPPDVAFAEEWGNIEAILVYDPVSGWLHYDSNAPSWTNTLTYVNNRMGIWIKFIGDSDNNLQVNGKVPTGTTIGLVAGWNLVGYPSSSPDTADNVLAGTSYDGLQKYDALAPYLITDMLSTEQMNPCEAYWVHVPANANYTV